MTKLRVTFEEVIFIDNYIYHVPKFWVVRSAGGPIVGQCKSAKQLMRTCDFLKYIYIYQLPFTFCENLK